MAKNTKLSKDEEQDAALATAMATVVLSSEEAQSNIQGMMESADPIVALGQLVANAVMQLREAVAAQGMDMSDRIWLADGGVADRLSVGLVEDVAARTGADLLGEEDKVWIEALNVIKLASQSGSGPAQEGQPAPEAEAQQQVPAGPFGGM